ncbi:MULTISPECIES: nuclear transport factor 2 family protein [unclassified Kaistella]|uniref:nuclear transport factor 2 family protein n=1 Tax=unclassified Kaistella TaxID=2762626 RepID=UPI0027358A5E|nr:MULTISPECIES: nuclear transport factor 2 family protein [unclassified Kaistella]MDP2453364.1 nuclear transport factor 2 family protein [Kaistella sp. SH11-4b]MDP2456421.1 nuclear transport factor 2 family protein [Kaistella sp. SH40-3]MDP2459177.1 nuclear transport factor 2 family protein [Kaistella sp. SH19-2b]
MKKNIVFTLIAFLLVCSNSLFSQKKGFYENVQKKNVGKVLDDLNLYASKADFKNYFKLYAEESTFIGTDANEVWNKKEFMDYSKPHFEKGKAWNFTSLKRNITFSADGKYAWFDELLDTQMKLCRGSGVLEKIGTQWKIKQYVLSMTVPNDVSNEIIKIKTPIEDVIISGLKK